MRYILFVLLLLYGQSSLAKKETFATLIDSGFTYNRSLPAKGTPAEIMTRAKAWVFDHLNTQSMNEDGHMLRINGVMQMEGKRFATQHYNRGAINYKMVITAGEGTFNVKIYHFQFTSEGGPNLKCQRNPITDADEPPTYEPYYTSSKYNQRAAWRHTQQELDQKFTDIVQRFNAHMQQ